MGDTETNLPPSKKRAAGRQLSRDNPGLDDEEESSEQETGTFKRASDEVLAGRRIVKVRRQQPSSTPSAPPSNPFAGIQLVPSINSSAATSDAATEVESEKTVAEEIHGKNDADQGRDKAKDDNDKQIEIKADEAVAESVADEKKPDLVNEESKSELADEKATEEDETENEDKNGTEGITVENKDMKDNGSEKMEKAAEAATVSSFQQLSGSQNAFTGLAGTGFSSSTFSFGSLSKDGSSLGSGSIFGLKNDQSSINGNSSLFGTGGVSIGTKSEGSGFPSMQEVLVETGEENEKAVFTADSALFEFIEGSWKERGKGELKVNVSTNGTGKARLVMRARGNYRLILNASLYPDMKLTNMDKKGITFACMNSTAEEKDVLSTFALKFKDVAMVEEFRAAVIEHKGKPAAPLKTPENSP